MKKVLITGIAFGLFLGIFMMFIGASHNSQGEFTGDLPYLLTVGISWAIPVWIITALIALIFKFRQKKIED